MTDPQGENQKINVQELFVTLGRLEGKVDGLSGIAERLGTVEILAATTSSEVRSIQGTLASQGADRSRKPQWPAVVSAVVGVVTGISVIVGLFFTLNQIASAITQSGVTP